MSQSNLNHLKNYLTKSKGKQHTCWLRGVFGESLFISEISFSIAFSSLTAICSRFLASTSVFALANFFSPFFFLSFFLKKSSKSAILIHWATTALGVQQEVNPLWKETYCGGWSARGWPSHASSTSTTAGTTSPSWTTRDGHVTSQCAAPFTKSSREDRKRGKVYTSDPCSLRQTRCPWTTCWWNDSKYLERKVWVWFTRSQNWHKLVLRLDLGLVYKSAGSFWNN